MTEDKAKLSNKQAAADLLLFHPKASMFPLMIGEEFKTFVADIKQNGLHVPITTTNDGKVIIEGRNRYRACLNAKVEPRYTPFQGEEKDIVPFIISANIHRRHLTAKQKNYLLVKLLKLHPEKSDRQIGEMGKSSKNTAAAVRRDLEARGQIDHVEKRTDSQGRKQPAKKKSPKLDTEKKADAPAVVDAEKKTQPAPAKTNGVTVSALSTQTLTLEQAVKQVSNMFTRLPKIQHRAFIAQVRKHFDAYEKAAREDRQP